MSKKCPTCGKTVYFAERVSAIGMDFHKLCLKCNQCSKRVDPGSVSEHDGKPYCKGCYGSVIGLKGYGFGNSIDSHVSHGAAKGYGAGATGGGGGGSGGGGGGGKFCSNCGAAATGGKFCSGCGTALL